MGNFPIELTAGVMGDKSEFKFWLSFDLHHSLTSLFP